MLHWRTCVHVSRATLHCKRSSAAAAPYRSRAQGRLLHPEEWRAYMHALDSPSTSAPSCSQHQRDAAACSVRGGVAGVCQRMAVAAKVAGCGAEARFWAHLPSTLASVAALVPAAQQQGLFEPCTPPSASAQAHGRQADVAGVHGGVPHAARALPGKALPVPERVQVAVPAPAPSPPPLKLPHPLGALLGDDEAHDTGDCTVCAAPSCATLGQCLPASVCERANWLRMPLGCVAHYACLQDLLVTLHSLHACRLGCRAALPLPPPSADVRHWRHAP